MASLLVVLLGILGTLQYRWTGELERADRARRRVALETSAHRLTLELGREVARLALFFQVPPGTTPEAAGELAGLRLAAWRERAPYPELVSGVYRSIRRGAGDVELARLTPSGATEVLDAGDPERLRLAAAAELVAATPADTLPPRWSRPRGRGPGRFGSSRPRFEPLAPAVIVPLAPPATAPAAIVVALDREWIGSRLLPALVERLFAGPGGLEYRIALVDRQGGVIYRSDPGLDVAAMKPDLERPVFGFVGPDEMRALLAEVGLPPGPEGLAPGMPPDHPGHAPPGAPPEELASDEEEAGAWRLLVQHEEGSLDVAVGRARRRNLALGLGVLALLGGAIVLVLVSGRRARRLARQRMELVASVSHELRTPLTAVRSLAQNLADGVIDEPSQVRRYGATIEREGTRLTELVEQALEYAAHSGGGAPAREPVDLEVVVDEALDELAPLVASAGVELERRRAADPVVVEADRHALLRVVRNLVANALAHGGSGGWIGVETALDRSRPGLAQARLQVADRGPGVSKRDLPRLFEPFYRGTASGSRRPPGSGLGLALVDEIVRSHGGRITVENRGGAVFTVVLPAAGPEPSR